MRRLPLLFLVAPLAAAPLRAGVVRNVLPGAATGGPVPVVVLTPPSYDAASSRRYPVVYFLHDAYGDENELLDRGVAATLDAAFRANAMKEFVVVCPRGVGTWWADAHDGRTRRLTFLEEELAPWAETRLRVKADRGGRAVAGISMGGYGALRWALAAPERFRVAAGLSPALQQLTWRFVSSLPFLVRPSLLRVFGASEADNSLRANDLSERLLDDPTLGGRAPEVLLRCGTEDKYRLDQIVSWFDRLMRAVGGRSTLVLERGTHDWRYWRTSLPALLKDTAERLDP